MEHAEVEHLDVAHALTRAVSTLMSTRFSVRINIAPSAT